MIPGKRIIVAAAGAICSFSIFFACKTSKTNTASTAGSQMKARILVFTKTRGYFHESIPAGALAIRQLGQENGFVADTTSDGGYFTEDSLKHYNAVVFLSTT